jgi:hypothetical protein
MEKGKGYGSMRVCLTEGVPGFRLRTPHSFETACFSAGAAVMTKPASTMFLPTLWAARCVPFTIAAEKRGAAVLSIMLVQ